MERLILERIKAGELQAFEELYELYAEYALRVATAITRNQANAADVVQETFIRVYRGIDNFDLNRPFKPWFYRILINECNRLLKKRGNTILIGEYMEDNPNISTFDFYGFEEYEELYRAMGSLNHAERTAITLKYLKGFKEIEVAEILGLNINTLKSRLLRGRHKLKRMIEKYEKRREING